MTSKVDHLTLTTPYTLTTQHHPYHPITPFHTYIHPTTQITYTITNNNNIQVAKRLAMEQQKEQEMAVVADTFRAATLQALCFCRWSEQVYSVLYRRYALAQLQQRIDRSFTRVHFALWRTAQMINERAVALEAITSKRRRRRCVQTWRHALLTANKVCYSYSYSLLYIPGRMYTSKPM